MHRHRFFRTVGKILQAVKHQFYTTAMSQAPEAPIVRKTLPGQALWVQGTVTIYAKETDDNRE